MAKVILICGKIASGKTFYCKRLLESCPAVRLSVDELTARIGKLGELHDTVSAAAQSYLLERAADIVRAGADALLDWGFWSRSSREEASRFFQEQAIPTEWHYIHVSEARWRENIQKRNAAVLAGETSDYYVDQGLLQKLLDAFEEPEREEMDVWFELG